jgi:pimeloyl-ACP methyl ester carboxylesterase
MRRSDLARREYEPVASPIWSELLAGVELGFLWVSPVFLGYGIPHGDGSGVVLVPGFLGTDFYLAQLRSWLGRIGYRPYYSGISTNADCPNLLIRRHLTAAIEEACESTGRKVHVIGHSLGGTMARAIAAQMPDHVASVITLAAPIRKVVAHAAVLHVAERVRKGILKRNGSEVLPDCYTAKCTCNFLASLMGRIPACVRQTAIYSKCDGIMDWRVCRTGNPRVDIEVSSTHVGLVCSPLVYKVLADRLAGD